MPHADREDLCFRIGLEAQALPEKLLDQGAYSVKMILVVMNYAKIVHVAHVQLLAQAMLHKFIKLMQVDVGK